MPCSDLLFLIIFDEIMSCTNLLPDHLSLEYVLKSCVNSESSDLKIAERLPAIEQ